MHDVAGEIAGAEGCAETISANVLKECSLENVVLSLVKMEFKKKRIVFLKDLLS